MFPLIPPVYPLIPVQFPSEKTRKILEDNIIRLMMEKNLTARALSIRIEKNEWYITRMLNGNIDPSLQVISKIAEILRVSAADLFSKNDG